MSRLFAQALPAKEFDIGCKDSLRHRKPCDDLQCPHAMA